MVENFRKARNSSLRSYRPAKPIAEFLNRTFPNITADDVTETGKNLILTGTILKTLPEKWTFGNKTSTVAFLIMLTGLFGDALDGEIACLTGTTSEDSAFKDFKTDRDEEFILGSSKAISGAINKDLVRLFTSLISFFSGLGPSALRAANEKLGVHPPETGKNIITAAGTRVFRGISGVVTTSFPDAKIRGIRIQPLLDSFSSFANLLTTLERYKILQKAKKGEFKDNIDESATALAARKSEYIKKIGVFSTIVLGTIGVIGLIRTRQNKNLNTGG